VDLLDGRTYTIRDVCSVVGKIVATGPANRYARLYTTRSLVEITEALKVSKDDYSRDMQLSEAAAQELLEQSGRLLGSECPIYESDPDLEIRTDASHLGWGAFAPFRDDRFRSKENGDYPR
jgi:hypothetical protein